MRRRAQPWLGTLVEISADSDDGAIDAAFAEVALVHRLMSFHDPASEVSRLNTAAAGVLIAVHAHTWQVLRLAEEVDSASQGMFNVACAPQLVAWDYLPPVADDVPQLQPAQSVYRCEADNTVRKLRPGWIDLGGIAKGYAVDLAVQALRRAGTANGCVNAGGDLRTLGSQDWPVAVRDPGAPQRPSRRLWLRDEALATSASYFSGRRHAGRQVSALLDGRDGRALEAPVSVSVRAPLCAAADALTKVVFASGDPGHPALAQWQATAFII
ncbi:MAG TPA: FAD:protein FMN transferase [Pseudoduganella sp.]